MTQTPIPTRGNLRPRRNNRWYQVPPAIVIIHNESVNSTNNPINASTTATPQVESRVIQNEAPRSPSHTLSASATVPPETPVQNSLTQINELSSPIYTISASETVERNDGTPNNTNNTESTSATPIKNQSADMFSSYYEDSDPDPDSEAIIREQEPLEISNQTDDNSIVLQSIQNEENFNEIDSNEDVPAKNWSESQELEQVALRNKSLVADSSTIEQITVETTSNNFTKTARRRTENNYCCDHVHLFGYVRDSDFGSSAKCDKGNKRSIGDSVKPTKRHRRSVTK